MRAEFLDGGNRKRPAPTEPTDSLDPKKRQRLGADVPATPPQASSVPPLPPGPVSIAQLFTLTQDDGAKAFDVKAIPIDLVNRIIVPILVSIDRAQLDTAMNVRACKLPNGFRCPVAGAVVCLFHKWRVSNT